MAQHDRSAESPELLEPLREGLREAARVDVVIRSAKLPVERSDELADRIQQVLTAEVARLESLRLRDADEAVADAMAQLAAEHEGASSLTGFGLDEELISGLHSKLRILAEEIVPSEEQPRDGPCCCCCCCPPARSRRSREGETAAPATDPVGTISQSLGPDDGCIKVAKEATGGEAFSLTSIIPPPPQPEFRYWLSFGHGSDLVTMVVHDTGLPPDRAVIRLTNRMDWGKELVAWNVGQGAISTLSCPSKGDTASMEIANHCDFGTDTLVFRKPVFLGWWSVDVAHFVRSEFWEHIGGKTVDFTWVKD